MFGQKKRKWKWFVENDAARRSLKNKPADTLSRGRTWHATHFAARVPVVPRVVYLTSPSHA